MRCIHPCNFTVTGVENWQKVIVMDQCSKRPVCNRIALSESKMDSVVGLEWNLPRGCLVLWPIRNPSGACNRFRRPRFLLHQNRQYYQGTSWFGRVPLDAFGVPEFKVADAAVLGLTNRYVSTRIIYSVRNIWAFQSTFTLMECLIARHNEPVICVFVVCMTHIRMYL